MYEFRADEIRILNMIDFLGKVDVFFMINDSEFILELSKFKKLIKDNNINIKKIQDQVPKEFKDLFF